MTNPTLFVSALVCGCVHVGLLIVRPGGLRVIYVLGVGTSLWNHGTASPRAKWCDRVLMAFVATTDAFTTAGDDIWGTLLLSGAVGSYFLAKMTRADPYHVLAHVLITLCHATRVITE
jgi:hypothetical protein